MPSGYEPHTDGRSRRISKPGRPIQVNGHREPRIGDQIGPNRYRLCQKGGCVRRSRGTLDRGPYKSPQLLRQTADHCSTGSEKIAEPIRNFIGGAERDRTVDLLNAIQALSQTELQPHRLGVTASQAVDYAELSANRNNPPESTLHSQGRITSALYSVGISSTTTDQSAYSGLPVAVARRSGNGCHWAPVLQSAV
jgi:hypothetical protein